MRRSVALAGVGAAAALGIAGALAQRRLVRGIESDPEHEALRRPLSGEEHEVRSADGTSLHVEEFGPPDAPKVILDHGWMCGIGFWRYQIESLSRDHRVIAYDKRGHGRSAPADDYSFDSMADDLDAVIEARVPEGERALVAGHSMGAMTLAAWAGRYPQRARERLAGCLMVNTGLGNLIDDHVVLPLPSRPRVRAPLGRLLLTVQMPVRSGPSPIADASVRWVTFGPQASPARVAFCRRMVLSCNPRARGACGASMSRMDLWHALDHIDAPSVVIAGEADRLTPAKHGRRIAESIAGEAELVELPGIGHMAPIEAPDEVTSRIRELASRTLAGAPVTA
jgi:pimeloyl-ACP methyl ester carboxylesterase